MFVNTKKFFLSKTVWLGLAALAVPFLEGVVDMIDLSEGGYETLVYILGVLILVLRSITTKPVSLSGKKKYVEE